VAFTTETSEWLFDQIYRSFPRPVAKSEVPDEMAELRKLAAILAADVVGYSRLASADEDRTLARLRSLRSDLIDPVIAVHHGKVVKRTGDGILVEFRSVVDAVRCAIEIQSCMVERNVGLPPERRIEFRCGVHLGDVVEEGDGDLMGDGVNIAARLEGVAKPGTICLSEDAYRQVKSRLDFAVSDLGAQNLKNITEPVRVYSLEVGKSHWKPTKPAVPARRSKFVLLAAVIIPFVAIASGVWLAIRPIRGPEISSTIPRLSIVVLPFSNLSGDPARDYLADALTEGLTTSLSRIRDTFVIARSTAFTYKGKPVDVKQIGRDLGVRYVLEGSEQHAGGAIRVSAQLIDAQSGAHLWADQFDADRADLLQMQDEIVTRLSWPLQIRLVDVDAARLARATPGDLDAQDLAMRCLAGFYDSAEGSSEWEEALGSCEHALQMDNRNVIALSLIPFRYILPVVKIQSTDPKAAIRQADEFASRALAIDPNYYWAHAAKATVLLAQRRPDAAIAELERSLALNPGFAPAYIPLALANNFVGQPEKTIQLMDRAIRLSPRDPKLYRFYHMKGWAFLMLHQDDQAIEWLRRELAINPDEPISQALLVAALALSGQSAEAHEALQRYYSLGDTKSTTIAQYKTQQLSISSNQKYLAFAQRFRDGLREAGMPEE
jgi:adenylate cyclase